MNPEQDFSDNNSYTTSTNFRLRIPKVHKQPSVKYFNFDSTSHYQPTSNHPNEHFNDNLNSGRFMTNQSNADSGDYPDLELKTLNNSDQIQIFDNKDRRPTMNVIPTSLGFALQDSASSYMRDPHFLRNSSNTSLYLREAPSQQIRRRASPLNNSLPSYSPFNVSAYARPSGNAQESQNKLFNFPPKDMYSQAPQYIQDKFGSILVNKAQNFHRNSTTNIPSESVGQRLSFNEMGRPRNNSQKIPNSQVFMVPQTPQTPLTSSSGKKVGGPLPFKVNSLQNLPGGSGSYFSSKSIDKKGSLKKSFFKLKSIKEKREDEPERKVSQSFDAPNSSSTAKEILFGYNSRKTQKSSKNQESSLSKSQKKTSSLQKLSANSTSNLSKKVSHSVTQREKADTFQSFNLLKTHSDQHSSPFHNASSSSKNKKIIPQNFRSFEAQSSDEFNQKSLFPEKKIFDQTKSKKKSLTEFEKRLAKNFNMNSKNEQNKFIAFSENSVKSDAKKKNLFKFQQKSHFLEKGKKEEEPEKEKKKDIPRENAFQLLSALSSKGNPLMTSLNSKCLSKKLQNKLKMQIEEENYKVSPKIQKKKNFKRKKSRNSLFKAYKKLNNLELIKQLDPDDQSRNFQQNEVDLQENLLTTSIDFSNQNKKKKDSLFAFKNENKESLFKVGHPPKSSLFRNLNSTSIADNRRNLLLRNKLQLKQEPPQSPLTHLLSPNPHFRVPQKPNGQFGFHFFSNQKAKPQKMYSLTPNPKINSASSKKYRTNAFFESSYPNQESNQPSKFNQQMRSLLRTDSAAKVRVFVTGRASNESLF